MCVSMKERKALGEVEELGLNTNFCWVWKLNAISWCEWSWSLLLEVPRWFWFIDNVSCSMKQEVIYLLLVLILFDLVVVWWQKFKSQADIILCFHCLTHCVRQCLSQLRRNIWVVSWWGPEVFYHVYSSKFWSRMLLFLRSTLHGVGPRCYSDSVLLVIFLNAKFIPIIISYILDAYWLTLIVIIFN